MKFGPCDPQALNKKQKVYRAFFLKPQDYRNLAFDRPDYSEPVFSYCYNIIDICPNITYEISVLDSNYVHFDSNWTVDTNTKCLYYNLTDLGYFESYTITGYMMQRYFESEFHTTTTFIDSNGYLNIYNNKTPVIDQWSLHYVFRDYQKIHFIVENWGYESFYTIMEAGSWRVYWNIGINGFSIYFEKDRTEYLQFIIDSNISIDVGRFEFLIDSTSINLGIYKWDEDEKEFDSVASYRFKRCILGNESVTQLSFSLATFEPTDKYVKISPITVENSRIYCPTNFDSNAESISLDVTINIPLQLIYNTKSSSLIFSSTDSVRLRHAEQILIDNEVFTLGDMLIDYYFIPKDYSITVHFKDVKYAFIDKFYLINHDLPGVEFYFGKSTPDSNITMDEFIIKNVSDETKLLLAIITPLKDKFYMDELTKSKCGRYKLSRITNFGQYFLRHEILGLSKHELTNFAFKLITGTDYFKNAFINQNMDLQYLLLEENTHVGLLLTPDNVEFWNTTLFGKGILWEIVTKQLFEYYITFPITIYGVEVLYRYNREYKVVARSFYSKPQLIPPETYFTLNYFLKFGHYYYDSLTTTEFKPELDCNGYLDLHYEDAGELLIIRDDIELK